jgi:hypothetical protein
MKNKKKTEVSIIRSSAAEKWGVSVRRIQQLCETERIPGAVRPARDWLIPKNAVKPPDGRVNNRRQPKKEEETTI